MRVGVSSRHCACSVRKASRVTHLTTSCAIWLLIRALARRVHVRTLGMDGLIGRVLDSLQPAHGRDVEVRTRQTGDEL